MNQQVLFGRNHAMKAMLARSAPHVRHNLTPTPDGTRINFFRRIINGSIKVLSQISERSPLHNQQESDGK